MDDQLKSKLLASDELSLEIEEFEQKENQTKGLDALEKGFRSFYKNPDEYERALSTATLLPALELTWENITLTPTEDVRPGICNRIGSLFSSKIRERQRLAKRRHILDNVCGVAKGGELLAIMGSSGAGKTSLLNALTQRNLENVEVQGSIKVNGLNMGRKGIRRLSAYVQQHDLFIGTMTVREHLIFSVRLRMGRNYSKEEQEDRVQAVMKDLDLTRCADTMIGWPHRLKGISGGERKRLAFASEILTSPPLLFCDEPTSGLDAYLGRQVVNVLKDLAIRKRMTIVFTIHQPSSQVFELFDKVCLLANGRVAFLGTPDQATQQWTQLQEPVPDNFNPADHFISSLAATDLDDAQAADKVQRICNYFEKSDVARELKETIKQAVPGENSSTASETLHLSIQRRRKYRATWFQQFVVLTKRSFLVTVREPMLLKVRFMQTLISALLLGIIYFNTQLSQRTIMNINGLLYQSLTSMNFLFQFASVGIFCEEYPVFLRENLSGIYRVDTYFIAKNVAEAVQYVIYPTVFASVLYWMSGLYRTFGAFAFFLLNLLLVTNVAISISYAFACVFARTDIAIAVLPILVIPLLAFGGFFINQATLPVYFLPLRYLSYFGFVYENLVINEWSDIDEIRGCGELAQNSTCLRNGPQVIRSLGFSRRDIWPNLIGLVVMILAFRLIAGIALGIRAARRK